MVVPGPNIVRAYSPHNLVDLLSGEEWQCLEPNYPTDNDLWPASLNTYHVEEIADCVLRLTASGQNAPYRTEEQPDYLGARTQISCGTIEPIGTGESKSCYRLRTELGSTAIQVLGHDEDLGLIIPESHYLTPLATSPTQRLWEYADVRTYLILPYSENIGVRFQEDGGTPYAQSRASHIPGPKWLARKRAMHRIKAEKALEARDLQYTTGEIEKERHYLKKNGYLLPLVIDVPVVERGYQPR
jgi:hypothetical protein